MDRQLLIEPARHAGPATAIVDAVVKLGNQIGVEVVAQGLQTPSDVDAAAAAGCRYGQGDVLGSPVPAEHFEASLDCHTPGVASPPWTGRSNS